MSFCAFPSTRKSFAVFLVPVVLFLQVRNQSGCWWTFWKNKYFSCKSALCLIDVLDGFVQGCATRGQRVKSGPGAEVFFGMRIDPDFEASTTNFQRNCQSSAGGLRVV